MREKADLLDCCLNSDLSTKENDFSCVKKKVE